MSTLNTDSTEKLNGILDGIEPDLANELFTNFYLRNPLEFANYLHSLGNLPDAVKRDLLALKVSEKSPYKGVDLSVLVEAAMQQQWAHLVATASKAENKNE